MEMEHLGINFKKNNWAQCIRNRVEVTGEQNRCAGG